MPLVRSRLIVASAVLLCAVMLDQITKWLIIAVIVQPAQVIPLTPFLNFSLGFNTGISFGLFREVLEAAPFVLVAGQVVIVAGLFLWAVMSKRQGETIGLGLMAGGALGNVLDRARQGAVTDFLDLHAAGWHWPTFNMADVAITVGAGLLVHAGLFASSAQGDRLPEP